MNPKKTTRTLKDYYDVTSYRRAIERACRQANAKAKKEEKPEIPV